MQLTQDGLRQFAENNKEDIEVFKYRQSYIRLQDGTEIFGLYDSGKTRGCRLDQLILFDDDRWLIKSVRYDFICFIMEHFVYHYSCVPEEFQIIEYEDIR